MEWVNPDYLTQSSVEDAEEEVRRAEELLLLSQVATHYSLQTVVMY